MLEKWYVWGGNGVPKDTKRIAKVIHEDGHISYIKDHLNVNLEGHLIWLHYGDRFDIVAYTLGEKVESKSNKL